MTVAELIEELKQMPQYMQVYTDVANLDEDGLKVNAVKCGEVTCKQDLSGINILPGGRETNKRESFAVVVLEVY